MTEIINLNKARKAKKKADKKSQSDENRVHFGMTRGEKALGKAGRDKHDGHLDGLRIYTPPSDPE